MGLVVGTISQTARVSIVRWNLKEAGDIGKALSIPSASDKLIICRLLDCYFKEMDFKMKSTTKIHFIKIFTKLIQVIEDYGSLIALMLMLILVNLAILLRLFFNFESSAWEEIARFLSIWMYMLAISIASREDSHLSAGFLDKYIHSEKNKYLLQIIFKVIMIICVSIFTWCSVEQINWVIVMQQKSLVLMIDMWLVYLAFVVGGVFFLIHTIYYLYFYFNKYLSIVTKKVTR